MISTFLTKLKIELKRLLGKCVYACVYIKNSYKELKIAPPQEKNKKRHKNKLLNLLIKFSEQWKIISLSLIGFLVIYYGIGAAVSSKINNNLNYNIQITEESPRYTTEALRYILKTQIDDTAWTPALPIIFPASILDNLPNFQIGAKDSSKYLIKRLSVYHADNNLKEAADLLNYPANIWLFSQTADDKLAPGSAKQYRKALAKLTDFANSPNNQKAMGYNEFLYILSGLENIIEKQLQKLSLQVNEHNSELLDFKADNIFYYAKGNTFTVYYILQALTKDYQDFIVETNEYEDFMTALSFLRKACELEAFSIKNAAPQDSYSANHLLYLGYYLSRAQNYIQKIHNNIEKFIRK